MYLNHTLFSMRFWLVSTSMAMAPCLHAEPFVNIWLGVNSSGVVDGVSYTDNNTQLAVNADVQLHQNITLGGQIHTAQPEALRQRHRGFSAYVAADKAINDRWLVGGSFTHRHFIDGAIDWNYSYVNTYIKHQSGVSAELMYSSHYYHTDFAATQLLLSHHQSLNKFFYTRSTVGFFDLESALDYQHAQLVLGANIRRTNIELGYSGVSDTLKPTPIGLITSPKWQLRLIYFLY